MNDLAIGSSSPHWAFLFAAGLIPSTSCESGGDGSNMETDLELPTESSLNSWVLNGSGSGRQMSPFAPVFHPSSSNAAQQAAQSNSTDAQTNSEVPNNREGYGSNPAPWYGLSKVQHQLNATYPCEGGDIESMEENCNSFGLCMKTHGTGGEDRGYNTGPSQHQASPPNWRDYDNWTQGSVSLSENEASRIEVAVPPRTGSSATAGAALSSAGEWSPYSYATKPVLSSKSSSMPHLHESLHGPSTSDVNKNQNPSLSSNPHTRLDSNSNAWLNSMDFPPFDEFAQQLDGCGVSRNEFLATLRNLMIRANEMMVPLLQGQFARMTPVQMATYTTAILETPPLHPSLFMPADAPRFSSSNSWDLPPCHPHSLTPQDLAKINRRPKLVNAATQTEFYPPKGPWMAAGDSGRAAGQCPPPPAQFGFWVPMHPHGHPQQFMNPHPQGYSHPHGHPHHGPHQMPYQLPQQMSPHHMQHQPMPHSRQMPRPMTGHLPGSQVVAGGGARYGFRVGPYSPMPYRYNQFTRGRQAKHFQPCENLSSNGSNSNNPYEDPNRGEPGANGGEFVGGFRNHRQRLTAAASTMAEGAATLATNSEDTDMSIGLTADQSGGGGDASVASGGAHSSSSNVSSSSSASCFPNHNMSMRRHHRRRRSTTTECSSEDIEGTHEAEATEEQEPDRRYRPRQICFEANSPEMFDHVVAYVVPNANPYFQMQHLPLDPGYVQMQQQQQKQNPVSMEAPHPAIPLSGGQMMPEVGQPQEPAASSSYPKHSSSPHRPQAPMSAEAGNIFMRPTGPMMPILHDRAPLPPIVFNVNSNLATTVMTGSQAASLAPQHHMMNDVAGLSMPNPKKGPQNLPQGPKSGCTLRVNANGNDRGYSNIFIPKCHPLLNGGAPPTPSEDPVEAEVEDESANSTSVNPQPTYASLLR